MTKTKQTQCGGSSARPTGMATARFSDEGGNSQFEDIDEEEWPDMENPSQAAEKGEASKSAGQAGSQDVGAEGGAQAPPNVAQAPIIDPTQPKSSTSKGDTQDPTDKPPQEPINPEEENEPGLADYVNSYRQAAKVWFDTVQASKEQVYITLYDTLLQIGNPHISKLSNSARKTVLDCIADKSGKYLSEDDFAVYVAREDVEIKKKQVAVSNEAKAAIKEYYKAVQDLCEAQTAFMKNTWEMESKIENKEIFLDIIRQMQFTSGTGDDQDKSRRGNS